MALADRAQQQFVVNGWYNLDRMWRILAQQGSRTSTTLRRDILARGLGERVIDMSVGLSCHLPLRSFLAPAAFLAPSSLRTSLCIQPHHDAESQHQLKLAASLTRHRLYMLGPTISVFLCALLSFSASASPRLDTQLSAGS